MVRVLTITGIVGLFLFLAVTATATAFDPADYDANGNQTIERDEVVLAIKDYFGGTITRDDVVTVIKLYFTQTQLPDPEIPPPEDLAGDQESTSLSATVKRVRPSVVMVVSRVDPIFDALAFSGFIFKVEGQTAYVLTAQHGVGWSEEVQIVVNDEDTYSGTVVNRDAARDLAVVKICCGSFQALEFGDVSSLEVGDDVVAIGYPLDDILPRNVDPWYPYEYIPATVTKGIVSAFRYHTDTDTRFIQHDASISGGSSGGPLFNVDGEVVGINDSRIPVYWPIGAENMGLAISAVTIQETLPSLLVAATDHTFGPINGLIGHSRELIDFHWANGFLAADLEAEVAFKNPCSASLADWSYGLVLRDRLDSPKIYFVVATSSGTPYWRVYSRQGAEWNILGEGVSGNIRTVADQSNQLSVSLVGNKGTFNLNGIQVATRLDLGGATHSGYAGVAANFFVGHGTSGAYTVYTGFYGESLD